MPELLEAVPAWTTNTEGTALSRTFTAKNFTAGVLPVTELVKQGTPSLKVPWHAGAVGGHGRMLVLWVTWHTGNAPLGLRAG